MKKNLPISDTQIATLRKSFQLRIEAMKKGRLSMDLYVESGKFYDDLTDANIPYKMNQETYDLVDKLFKSELARACLNPKMYDWFL
jgi:hypothetical protein